MNNLKNAHEDKQMDLKGRVLNGLGDKLVQLAAAPRTCWLSVFYEPSLPIEVIKESADN